MYRVLLRKPFKTVAPLYLSLFVVLLIGCSLEPPPHELTGEKAPPVRLDLMGGGTLDLQSHRGKEYVLLDFWATWCGPCRVYMPIIESVAEDFSDRDVVLYAVNSAEHPNKIQQYLQNNTIASPIALDVTGAASIVYNAASLPQTVLIDKEGRIQKIYVGVDSQIGSVIRRDLEWLLRGESLLPDGTPRN